MTRPGYKMTEIEEIPQEWKLGSLASVSENENGIVAGPFGSNLKVSDYTNVGIPLIRLQNIASNSFVYKDIKYISEEKAEELFYHSFMAGDIVLAKLGDPIGVACIIPPELPHGIVVADVVRIRVSEKKADKHFVVQILNSPICLQQLKSAKIGSTRPRVNLSNVRNIRLILPSLQEQQKIAEILSSMDKAIQRVNDQVTKTERLKKGLMQTLLTKGIGHTKFKMTEIGKIPEEWALRTFKEILQIRKRKDEGKFEKIYAIPMELIPERGIYCSYRAIEANEVIPPTYCESGDILLPKITPSVENGKQGIVPVLPSGHAFATSEVYSIVAENNLTTLYTFYLLKMDLYRKHLINSMIGTTGRQRIPKYSIFNLVFPIPPLSEQQKIAEILSNIDSYLESLENYKIKLGSLKNGLMQDLLTGKFRVNNLKGVLNINGNTV